MIWSWLHRHPRLVDLSLVGLLLVLGVGGVIARDDSPYVAVLVALETLPLLWRRRRPVAVTVVVAAAVVALAALGAWVIPLQLGVALYTLTATAGRRADRAVAVGAIVAVGAAALASERLEF